MKVFISCPMKGLSDSEILKIREDAKNKVKERFKGEDLTFINSYFKEFNLPENNMNIGIYYLGRSILKLSEADLVVFTPGWETARGCRIECTIAKDYDLKIMFL